MKLTQQLLSITEESDKAKSNQQQAELLKAHQKAKKISAENGVVQHVNKDKNTGQIYVSDWIDDDETLATYNNGKLKEDVVTEAEDKEEAQTADQLEVGDEVEITGNVEMKDSIGTIERFGSDKKFVVVKMARGGALHSFHSSDVTAASTEHENGVFDDSEDTDEDDEKDEDTFYVAFYDESEHASWIGCVTKSDGGKWHEERYKGKPDYRWGTSYMSYLKPHEVMAWIHKDYRHGMEIEGPFDDPKDAEDYVEHNWGVMKESAEGETVNRLRAKEKMDFDRMMAGAMSRDEFNKKWKKGKYTIKNGKEKLDPTGIYHNLIKGVNEAQSYTDFDDWKAAVLHSYPAQAKKIKFKGRMEGNKDTISAEVPGEDRSYGVWDQDTEKGVVLSEATASEKYDSFKGKSFIYHQYKIVQDGPFQWSVPDGSVRKFKTELAAKNHIDKVLTAKHTSVSEAVKDTIEAHGIKGMKREPWRRTFKDADAMVAWAEKFDAEIYGQRETDYAIQLKKDKPVKEDVHKTAVEWFKAEKPEQCPKCKSSDFYRTSFGNTQKIVCSKCGQVAAKKDIKEGVVSAVKGFVKHQTNMAKANKRGWETFGKGMGAALRDRNEKDPVKNAENERIVKQSIRDSNRYSDFADGGKGFNSTNRTTAEQDWDKGVAKVKGAIKGAADTVQRTLFKRDAKEGKEEEKKPENIKRIEKIGNKDHMFSNAKVIHDEIEEGVSPYKPNARVKIISGPKDCIGKEGTIGEVVTTNGQKSYTVDYDHDFNSDKPNFGAKSVRLQPKDIKLIRDKKLKEAKEEQLEVISKGAEKVLFTGTSEECKDFMRKHKSLKMDLRYKESGRLASYVL